MAYVGWYPHGVKTVLGEESPPETLQKSHLPAIGHIYKAGDFELQSGLQATRLSSFGGLFPVRSTNDAVCLPTVMVDQLYDSLRSQK
jgi:hypothetical protein